MLLYVGITSTHVLCVQCSSDNDGKTSQGVSHKSPKLSFLGLVWTSQGQPSEEAYWAAGPRWSRLLGDAPLLHCTPSPPTAMKIQASLKSVSWPESSGNSFCFIHCLPVKTSFVLLISPWPASTFYSENFHCPGFKSCFEHPKLAIVSVCLWFAAHQAVPRSLQLLFFQGFHS